MCYFLLVLKGTSTIGNAFIVGEDLSKWRSAIWFVGFGFGSCFFLPTWTGDGALHEGNEGHALSQEYGGVL